MVYNVFVGGVVNIFSTSQIRLLRLIFGEYFCICLVTKIVYRSFICEVLGTRYMYIY